MIALQELPVTLDEVIEAYEPVLMERLRQPRPALPGARELVVELRERGVPIALCTASYKRWVDAILPSAGLDGLFDVFSTCEMVTKTKPQPEPYLLAAEKLGVPPAECVAIEDSTNGLRVRARRRHARRAAARDEHRRRAHGGRGDGHRVVAGVSAGVGGVGAVAWLFAVARRGQSTDCPYAG